MKFLIPLFFIVCISAQLFGQEGLTDLKSLNDLQKQFNADAGNVRLIALLSPT